MTSAFWPIAEFVARGLEPTEREAVLGDLAETGETGWSALQGVLGLVMRRQAPVWQSAPPWVASLGMALPCGYLLTWVSASISCTFERLFGPKITSPHWWPTGHEGLTLFLCHVFLLNAWAWTSGYVFSSFSRRTAWFATGFCFIPFFFDGEGYNIYPLPKMCLLLFALPLFIGIHYGSRTTPLNPRLTLVLATVMSGVMFVCWSNGALWTPHWALLWPAWYLVAVTLRPGATTASGTPHLAQN